MFQWKMTQSSGFISFHSWHLCYEFQELRQTVQEWRENAKVNYVMHGDGNMVMPQELEKRLWMVIENPDVPWGMQLKPICLRSLLDHWKSIEMSSLSSSSWMTSERIIMTFDRRLRNGPNLLRMECDFSKLSKSICSLKLIKDILLSWADIETDHLADVHILA